MKVRFVRERTISGVTAAGPFLKVFELGDTVDLPDHAAALWIATGDAVKVDNTPKEPKKAAARKASMDRHPAGKGRSRDS